MALVRRHQSRIVYSLKGLRGQSFFALFCTQGIKKGSVCCK